MQLPLKIVAFSEGTMTYIAFIRVLHSGVAYIDRISIFNLLKFIRINFIPLRICCVYFSFLQNSIIH